MSITYKSYKMHLSLYPPTPSPFKALEAAKSSKARLLPLKPFKLRRYLVYIAFLHKMYKIVYISVVPPMAACPPPEVSKDFKSSKTLES